MKSLTVKMLVPMVVVFVFALISGCSSSQSKPTIENDLAVKSLGEALKANKPTIDVPDQVAFLIKDISISEPHFSKIDVIELVEKADHDGVKRKMWKVNVIGKAKVQYVLDLAIAIKPYYRLEEVTYTMYVYKDGNGALVSENGKINECKVIAAGWSI